MIGHALSFNYTNYRGEVAIRRATPKRLWFGETNFHTEPQWILTAFDHDKQADRDFALRDCDFSVGDPIS